MYHDRFNGLIPVGAVRRCNLQLDQFVMLESGIELGEKGRGNACRADTKYESNIYIKNEWGEIKL